MSSVAYILNAISPDFFVIGAIVFTVWAVMSFRDIAKERNRILNTHFQIIEKHLKAIHTQSPEPTQPEELENT